MKDYKPIRKITNRGSKKNTGFFPSKKNERNVAFESLIELDFIYLLEFDEKVISYFEQPFKLKYFYKNRTRTYTPDFLVNRTDKTLVIEIKPHKQFIQIINNEDKKQKYIVADMHCISIGQEFRIITDNDIRNGNFLNNIKYLFAYAGKKVPASDKLLIRNLLISTGPTSINNLIALLSNNKNGQVNDYYAYILSLIYSHNIYTDLSIKIDRNSLVFLKGGF